MGLLPLCLAACAGAAARPPAEFGVATRTPPVLKADPGPRYWPRLRTWPGIPGAERTARGRLGAAWYGGPHKRRLDDRPSVSDPDGADGFVYVAYDRGGTRRASR
jgi:hypothetical protein